MTKYKVFHRTWWKYNPSWPNKKEPQAGRKFFISWAYTIESARDICRVWNANNDPGKYDDMAEFEGV